MLTYMDTSNLMTFHAAWRISEGLPYEKEASMSKAWVSDAYRKLVRLGHQVMGGMGFMEDQDLQLYFKQAKSAELSFGDAYFHREMLAQQIGL
jgi:alkylation response protein AidB-like acyl-CoA dehydrogenase